MNIPTVAAILFATWPQFGRDAAHTGSTTVAAQPFQTVLASVVMDPFVSAELAYYGTDLYVHYAAPIIDGDDVFVEVKGGTFTPGNWSTQTWGVRALRWQGNRLVERWTVTSDWQPVPFTGGGVGPFFEPVFQPILANGFLYMPGSGSSVLRVNRDTGAIVDRLSPGSPPPNSRDFISGPLVADVTGNIYYNVLVLLATSNPWIVDIPNGWLVRIAPDGTTKVVTYSSIVTGAPTPTAQCRGVFADTDLPWPPSPAAIPPSVTCGSQRPGLNVAPAIANDGTIYTVSRAHFNSRYGYLVALNPDLTPKWTASLRDRLNDGCNVTLPPNGTPGGCNAGAFPGVDPADNTNGAGRVHDDSSSSPMIAPDGSVFYGAYTRYNYSQGHLMHFSASGVYLGSFKFGWDVTPGIYQRNNSYIIIIKDNHYPLRSYCDNPTFCPNARPAGDPQGYFVTALNPTLQVLWSTPSPTGFEWCINGPAIDGNGVSYINSEDGFLYAINPDGSLRQSIKLTEAIGQAYTPVVIDDHGRVYAEKAGTVFVVGGPLRLRAVRR